VIDRGEVREHALLGVQEVLRCVIGCVADEGLRVDSKPRFAQGRESELAAVRSEWSAEQRTYRDALEDALEVQIYFRTGETTLDPATEARLARLASLVLSVDELGVIVAGHADARGDEEFNEQLSAQRAAAVREVLLQAGVAAERITATAEGERQSTAAEGDLDALAMERRVNLSIVDTRIGNRVARQ
jgi:outer membrane protein OmpA-like peptidoglycan-associated protein